MVAGRKEGGVELERFCSPTGPIFGRFRRVFIDQLEHISGFGRLSAVAGPGRRDRGRDRMGGGLIAQECDDGRRGCEGGGRHRSRKPFISKSTAQSPALGLL